MRLANKSHSFSTSTIVITFMYTRLNCYNYCTSIASTFKLQVMLKYKLTNKVKQKYFQIDYTAVQKVQLSNVYVGRLMC